MGSRKDRKNRCRVKWTGCKYEGRNEGRKESESRWSRKEDEDDICQADKGCGVGS